MPSWNEIINEVQTRGSNGIKIVKYLEALMNDSLNKIST
jgi:hypothetical protein